MKEFLEHGIKRKFGDIIHPEGNILELGPGRLPWRESEYFLEYPEWDGEKGYIPFGDGQFSQIWAVHFLEHIENVIPLLRECERVLCYGGVMNVVVPYYNSNLHHMDLDHKHTFTEDTWKTLFHNEYYEKDKGGWQFAINFNMIYGVAERNLCLATQLVKQGNENEPTQDGKELVEQPDRSTSITDRASTRDTVPEPLRPGLFGRGAHENGARTERRGRGELDDGQQAPAEKVCRHKDSSCRCV